MVDGKNWFAYLNLVTAGHGDQAQPDSYEGTREFRAYELPSRRVAVASETVATCPHARKGALGSTEGQARSRELRSEHPAEWLALAAETVTCPTPQQARR